MSFTCLKPADGRSLFLGISLKQLSRTWYHNCYYSFRYVNFSTRYSEKLSLIRALAVLSHPQETFPKVQISLFLCYILCTSGHSTFLLCCSLCTCCNRNHVAFAIFQELVKALQLFYLMQASPQSYELGAIFIPIFQARKLKQRRRLFLLGHIASQWQN